MIPNTGFVELIQDTKMNFTADPFYHVSKLVEFYVNFKNGQAVKFTTL